MPIAMSSTPSALQNSTLGLHSLDQYEPLIGATATERILKKAESVRTLHVVHVSSTFYGGGVTEILTPLTLMMNALGIETGWRMVQGTPAFFTSTKKLHNTLQGETIEISEQEKAIYEQVVFENATRLHIDDADAVIVHDPQPLPLIKHFEQREAPWTWQCHIDLSTPNPAVWNYVRQFIEQYDAVMFSLPDYAQERAAGT
jgi:trehalose synthase